VTDPKCLLVLLTLSAGLVWTPSASSQPSLGDSLALTVRVRPLEFGPGEPAQVEIVLANRTTRTLVVRPTGCGALYYEIEDVRGRRYPQEHGALGCIEIEGRRTITLGPRERLHSREDWTATYTATTSGRATIPEGELRVIGTLGDGAGQLRSRPARVVLRRTDPFAAPGGVIVSLSIQPPGPKPGDTVWAKVTATNATAKAVVMRFRSTCPFRIAVTDDRSGGVAPRRYRSPGGGCEARSMTLQLGPGRSRDSVIAWVPDWPDPLVLDTTRMSFGGRQIWGALDFSRPLWSFVQFVVLCPPPEAVPGRRLPGACHEHEESHAPSRPPN
jgi:hypothetical protein